MTGKAIFASAILVGAGVCWVLYRPAEECTATVSDSNLDLFDILLPCRVCNEHSCIELELLILPALVILLPWVQEAQNQNCTMCLSVGTQAIPNRPMS